MKNNSKTVRPQAKILRDFIIKGNLTVEERLGVLATLNIIDENVSVVDRFNGLRKLRSVPAADENSFELNIVAAIEEGYQFYLPLAEDADFGIVPILEDESGPTTQQGEHETSTDFEKRTKQAEVDQTQREKDFVAQNQFKKKGEQKPLAKAMRAKGVSQDDVAAAADVNKSTISRLKTGSRKPSFELLQKLADMFGDIETLFPELN